MVDILDEEIKQRIVNTMNPDDLIDVLGLGIESLIDAYEDRIISFLETEEAEEWGIVSPAEEDWEETSEDT